MFALLPTSIKFSFEYVPEWRCHVLPRLFRAVWFVNGLKPEALSLKLLMTVRTILVPREPAIDCSMVETAGW